MFFSKFIVNKKATTLEQRRRSLLKNVFAAFFEHSNIGPNVKVLYSAPGIISQIYESPKMIFEKIN